MYLVFIVLSFIRESLAHVTVTETSHFLGARNPAVRQYSATLHNSEQPVNGYGLLEAVIQYEYN